MIRWRYLMIVLALPAILLAQNAVSQNSERPANAGYQPAVAPASSSNYYGGGGWSGSSGGGTVAGNSMNGMANMIRAQGQRNLNNSAAAVNMTQARSNQIQNRQAWTNTYFDMRNTNRQAMAAERGPNLTQEQLAAIAKAGVPKPLSPNQMDPVNGRLSWPSALQQDCFASQRKELDQLFATRTRYGTLDYSGQMRVKGIIDGMHKTMKSQIDQIPQQDYMTCQRFLKSLMYTGTTTDMD